MRRSIYRILNLILVLLMVLSFSTTVLADPEDEEGYDTGYEDSYDDAGYEDPYDAGYDDSGYDDLDDYDTSYDDYDYEYNYDYDNSYNYDYPDDDASDDTADIPKEDTGANSDEEDAENVQKPKKPARSASDGWPSPPELISESVLMLEADTGVTMYEKDINTRRYPASTTKIMTGLLALEKCSLTEKVTFSKTAVDLEEGASSIGAVEGEEMTMKDVLYGLMLPSGNECANAIAEHIAGSVSAFADMMNERAAELGCTDTHFANPHGLFDKDHYTTAHDMGLIALEAFNNSAFREIVSKSEYTIAPTNKNDEPRVLKTTHSMKLKDSEFYNEYVLGGKTGYLPESGRCLVTLAKKDNMSVITVTLFSSTYNGVFRDTMELLDFAFEDFAVMNITDHENRFAYTGAEAPVRLDPSAQVLIPSYITYADLNSHILFADNMDLTTLRSTEKELGLNKDEGRSLFAVIDYSFDGVNIGKANVILNNDLESFVPVFADVIHIRKWWIIAAAVLLVLIIVMFILIGSAARKRRIIKNSHSRKKVKRY